MGISLVVSSIMIGIITNISVLVVISVLLTAVAGLISAGKAAKKDPVVALRTE